MKYIIPAVVASVVTALLIFAAQQAHAQTVTVVGPDDMREACDLSRHEEAYGCYWHDDQSIIVRNDLTAPLFVFTLAHELGHHYLQNDDLSAYGNNEELAADIFAATLLYWEHSSETEKAFVLAAIRN